MRLLRSSQWRDRYVSIFILTNHSTQSCHARRLTHPGTHMRVHNRHCERSAAISCSDRAIYMRLLRSSQWRDRYRFLYSIWPTIPVSHTAPYDSDIPKPIRGCITVIASVSAAISSSDRAIYMRLLRSSQWRDRYASLLIDWLFHSVMPRSTPHTSPNPFAGSWPSLRAKRGNL